MRQVYGRFSDDLDVTTLFADALMNITPWQLWDQVSGEPAAGAATVEAKTALERALETPGAQRHPGALHVYIHLMEMSPFPERALPAADSLRGLVPDGGHLRHMPTPHGRPVRGLPTGRVVERGGDRGRLKYLDRAGAMNFYTLYRAHDYHFKIYGAMFLGQAEVALRRRRARQALPEDLLRVEVPPMADWAEGFVPMKLHALIRFGRWQEIIDLPCRPTRSCTA
jgi:hypothetical protein